MTDLRENAAACDSRYAPQRLSRNPETITKTSRPHHAAPLLLQITPPPFRFGYKKIRFF